MFLFVYIISSAVLLSMNLILILWVLAASDRAKKNEQVLTTLINLIGAMLIDGHMKTDEGKAMVKEKMKILERMNQ